MTDRAQRRAEDQAKIAAMPLSKRLAIVLGGVVVTIITASLGSLLLDGEVNPRLMAAVALAIGVMLAYQYLWAPSRRP